MSKRAAPTGGARGKKQKTALPKVRTHSQDPTRSIYYDPVFNPYGAPPPGMPYRERSTSLLTGTDSTQQR